MSNDETKPKRTYVRPTTPQQRVLLFRTYQESGDINKACQVSRIARRTFNYWLPRFREGGFAAVERERSRAPHRTRIPPTPPEIVQEVIAYRRAHPTAGYRTIAYEIGSAHSRQRVIGHAKVREILIEAGLVMAPPDPPRRRPPHAVHAPQPEQTVNLDLCLVPVTHQGQDGAGAVAPEQASAAPFPPSGPDDV